MAPLYEKLEVWQLAHRLALDIYRVTREFPSAERFGLTSQLRRAAVAVATNIVEGNARKHRREYVQFCLIARGSLAETKYLLRLSADLALMKADDNHRLSGEYERLGAMLQSLITRLQGWEAKAVS